MGTKRDASYKKYANEIKYCCNYSAEKPEVRHYKDIYIKIYTDIVNRIQLIYKDIYKDAVATSDRDGLTAFENGFALAQSNFRISSLQGLQTCSHFP